MQSLSPAQFILRHDYHVDSEDSNLSHSPSDIVLPPFMISSHPSSSMGHTSSMATVRSTSTPSLAISNSIAFRPIASRSTSSISLSASSQDKKADAATVITPESGHVSISSSSDVTNRASDKNSSSWKVTFVDNTLFTLEHYPDSNWELFMSAQEAIFLSDCERSYRKQMQSDGEILEDDTEIEAVLKWYKRSVEKTQ